eukprot:5607024-Prymnesium_polylepis.1
MNAMRFPVCLRTPVRCHVKLKVNTSDTFLLSVVQSTSRLRECRHMWTSRIRLVHTRPQVILAASFSPRPTLTPCGTNAVAD